MSRIVTVAPVVPDNVYTQAEITAELASLIELTPPRRALLERMHDGTRIGTRHTVLPIEAYRTLTSFDEANDHFIRAATDLGERAVRTALADAGLTPRDVDFILFTTVTGIAAPSIDGLLVARLGLRSDVKRLPSFGLGCVAGASGIARMHDYLLGHPKEVGVLLSVELCSLTLQRGDDTIANFVASGLFGDGAAAVVMVGSNRDEGGLTVVDTRSSYYPETEGVIGWKVKASGFEIVLTAGVADVIERYFPAEVAAFLADHSLTVVDIDRWIAHPGGPRVLEAFAAALDVPQEEFALSWDSLRRVGNLSSASVLHVLADTMKEPAGADSSALLFALGPGVSAEFVLLDWP